MFIFDILKRDDRRLRLIAVVVAAGMLILLAGLWFVQIVCAQRFQTNLIRQSFRRVNIPAIRGKILDRNGQVLAEDQPRYNAILYLEDLQGQFDAQYRRLSRMYTNEHREAITASGKISLPSAARRRLELAADCDVVSNITFRVSTSLEEPRVLNVKGFIRHYNDYPYVPFQIVPNLAPRQVAIFAEQLSGQPALELETQPVRVYPNGPLAAHLLGYVQRRDDREQDVSFALPDYVGVSGVERAYDQELRGEPGVKSVLVNNLNYRQREVVQAPNQPGNDVFLTINLNLQRATEKALASAQFETRGAAVVMDPRNGDILAIASAPTFDPDEFVPGHPPYPPGEAERLDNKKFTPQVNRAVSGAYPPGSTFRIITAIACLESGLDPEEVFDSPGEYRTSPTHSIGDTAGPGKFNFQRAFYRSSNTYFIHNGMKAGLAKFLEVAHRFHLGEKTRISTGQDPPRAMSPCRRTREFRFRSAARRMSASDRKSQRRRCKWRASSPPSPAAARSTGRASSAMIGPPTLAKLNNWSSRGASATTSRSIPGILILSVRRCWPTRNIRLRAPAPAERGGTAYTFFHDGGGTPYLGNFRVAGKTGTAEVEIGRKQLQARHLV